MSNPQLVYVVLEHSCDMPSDLIGVFSTEEEARRRAGQSPDRHVVMTNVIPKSKLVPPLRRDVMKAVDQINKIIGGPLKPHPQCAGAVQQLETAKMTLLDLELSL